MRRAREAIFLDTTYVLAFFGLELDIPGVDELDKALVRFDELHIGEVSVIEAKLLRLVVKDASFEATVGEFGERLDLLRGDERVIFHSFTSVDDRRFNMITGIKPGLSFFDRVILAQAISVGSLLTEDGVMLALNKNPDFTGNKEFNGFRVRKLRDLLLEMDWGR